jgi:putative tryptophan/tyrosine transport system substrate-binding protein
MRKQIIDMSFNTLLLARGISAAMFFALCSMLLAPCSAVEAQQPAAKIPRLGYLDSGSASDPQNVAFRDAFLQGLRDLGYVEGKNINIEYRYDEGKPERLQALAEELTRLKVDILMGMDTSAAQAAKKSTTSIPVIFTTGGSPIASGLVPSLARPGGNVTGVTINSPELVGKRLELLKEAVPKVSRFGFLSDADSASIKAMFNEAQGAAKVLGVQFQSVEVKGPKPDIEGAFRTMIKERLGALVTEAPPLISFHRVKIVQLAAQYRIPAIYTGQQWTNAGGLMSYGASRTDPYRRVAVYVDKILKGTKPADLPVEQPTKFEFVINLKTAKALNLTIPQSVLFRADKVIR